MSQPMTITLEVTNLEWNRVTVCVEEAGSHLLGECEGMKVEDMQVDLALEKLGLMINNKMHEVRERRRKEGE